MRFSNLHTHTTFSDGKHTLRENVLSALEKNMLSIGFSDHSFTPCDTSYCMKESAYGEYLQAIAALKKEFADRIPIFAGIELDLDTRMDCSSFDYVIASEHYIVLDGVTHPIDHSPQQQEFCIQTAFDGDVLAMARYYYDSLIAHVRRCKPTLVGHFDVITKFGLMPLEDASYQKIAAGAMEQVLKVCPYIEVNTGAISRGWRQEPYPSAQLLDTIRSCGGEVVLSSDSHHRDHLVFFFEEALELLRQAGFDHISVFNGKGYTAQEI